MTEEAELEAFAHVLASFSKVQAAEAPVNQLPYIDEEDEEVPPMWDETAAIYSLALDEAKSALDTYIMVRLQRYFSGMIDIFRNDED